MSELNITLIDVGWGDSIFIESIDNNGNSTFGLIDSNDTVYFKSSFIFLKRFFEKKRIAVDDNKPIFDFIILSHAHTDHGQGLKGIMKHFGTRRFWYPKSIEWSSLSYLIQYGNRSNNVEFHQSIDDTKVLPNLGDCSMDIIWPPYNYTNHDENNNSIVLVIELNGKSFLLTGDAEEEVWANIANQIPSNTQFFKVPHHGSVNGTFNAQGNSDWLQNLPQQSVLGISSHVRPFTHPDQEVINLLNNNNRTYFRTDKHYHITISSDGNSTSVKYSHV